MSAQLRFLLAAGLVASCFLPTFANAASSASQNCVVRFSPIQGRPVIFRDETGNLLGTSDEETDLQMPVRGNVLSSSIRSGGIDVARLLNGTTPMEGSDGKIYIKMVLPYDTQTAEGSQIEGGKTILLAISDFYVSRAVQPTGAGDNEGSGVPCDPNLVNKFDEVLFTKGVTALTSPDAVAPRDASQDAESSNDQYGSDEEVEEAPVTESIIAPKLGWGEEYAQRFLTSPTCSCARGACGITSPFGHRRRPRTRLGLGSAYHQGLDIGGGLGTPIIAAAPGCVNIVGKKYGFGYTIVIDHGNGWQTQYGHLKAPPRFRTGQLIRKGQCMVRGTQIGLMGNTGRSTGPHVHFEVHHNFRRIDPRPEMLGYSGGALSMSCSDQPEESELDRPIMDIIRAGQRRSPVGSQPRATSRSAN